MVQNTVDAATTSAFALVEEKLAMKPDLLTRRGGDIYPSRGKILTVARLLFPDCGQLFKTVNSKIAYAYVVRSSWAMDALPEYIARFIREGSCTLQDFRNQTRRLTNMILIFSLVHNIEHCAGLALDTLYVPKVNSTFGLAERGQLGEAQFQAKRAEEWVRPLPMPTAPQAFQASVNLMKGEDSPMHEPTNQDISVISACEWTLCTASVIDSDISGLNAGLAVFQGVPMRTGERRRLILDGRIRNPWPYKATNARRDELSKHRVFAQPGDTKALRTWTRSKHTRAFIATT